MPGGLRDDLLSLAAERIYRPVWSTEILAEISRNLPSAPFRMTDVQIEHLLSEMARAFPHAIVEGWRHWFGWVPPEVDEKDRHVVAAAFAADARIVVTANVRHFA